MSKDNNYRVSQEEGLSGLKSFPQPLRAANIKCVLNGNSGGQKQFTGGVLKKYNGRKRTLKYINVCEKIYTGKKNKGVK